MTITKILVAQYNDIVDNNSIEEKTVKFSDLHKQAAGEFRNLKNLCEDTTNEKDEANSLFLLCYYLSMIKNNPNEARKLILNSNSFLEYKNLTIAKNS